ncbi:MAG: hypothetical protein JOZ10_16820 [Acidobacteria bacterium]|nr:hypothetical protein [Acidobacteriota bacterium]MBV9148134.1 hypothetical protein [Acidobacteriota bacterium]
MSTAAPGPPIDPTIKSAAKWIALILFLLYCADLIWKLAHWNQYSAGLARPKLAAAIALRLLFMAFLLWVYMRARRVT